MLTAILTLRESFAKFVASKFAEAEGFRPAQSGDDEFYYVAHGDCFPAIPECVEPFHRSGRNTL